MPLIWDCIPNFPLIIDAAPPGKVKNKPMQHETIHISMCTLAEQKLRAEHFLSLSGKQSFPAPAGGRHLCAVQSSYGKQAIHRRQSTEEISVNKVVFHSLIALTRSQSTSLNGPACALLALLSYSIFCFSFLWWLQLNSQLQ